MQSSPPSPPHFPPPSPHGLHQTCHPQRDLETEHRITVTEQQLERHADRMSLHEKVMLSLAGGLYILFQDRFPQIAALIKGALP